MRTFILKIYDNLEKFLSFNQEGFLAFKIAAVFLSLWFFVLIVILLFQSKTFSYLVKKAEAFKSFKSTDKLDKEWKEIKRRFHLKDEANLKLAVIEADKLVDNLFKKMVLPGEDMAERMNHIDVSQLKTIDALWQAHRLRNRIVHESSFNPQYHEIERAIEIYEKTLKELGALD